MNFHENPLANKNAIQEQWIQHAQKSFVPPSMLSKWLSYSRAIYSTIGNLNKIQNTPNQEEVKALQLWGEHIFDKVCERFGRVFISSAYRNKSTNKLVGGSSTSGHLKGECGDLDGDSPGEIWASVNNNTLFKWIKENLKYDQLIAEFESNGAPKWVHVGYRAVGNRQQTLIATVNSAGKTVYMLYTDKLYQRIYKQSRDVSYLMRGEDNFEMPATDYTTNLDESIEFGLIEEEALNNKADAALTEADEVSTVVAKGPGVGTLRCEDGTSGADITISEKQTHTLSVGGFKITITVDVVQ